MREKRREKEISRNLKEREYSEDLAVDWR